MARAGTKKNSKIKLIRNSTAEFLIFTGQSKKGGIEARHEDGTLWLTQKLMAELFEVGIPTISHHIKNLFETSELHESSVFRFFRITADDGKSYDVKYYNLDVIISVGYRVNSLRATQFRQWATHVLREFAVKGYVLDRKRMENGAFLEFTERDILADSGRVTAEIAKAYAESEYEKYRIVQDRLFESDFDRMIKQLNM